MELHRRQAVPTVIRKLFLVLFDLGVDFRFGGLSALEQFIEGFGAVDLLLVVRLFRLFTYLTNHLDRFIGIFKRERN